MATIQGGYDTNQESSQAKLKKQTMTDAVDESSSSIKTGADTIMYGNNSGTYRPLAVNTSGELKVEIGI